MVTKTEALRTLLGDTTSTEPRNVIDQHRVRTAWFEGQHVTAEHFQRDQSYALSRAADMGRAIGAGVVEGLLASRRGEDRAEIAVSAGLGIAASGELVHLPNDIVIDISDIPVQRRLSHRFGGDADAIRPPETRTGLFVLTASTVEHTSNPIASYPVSVTSTRTLHDSVINEAVLFALTPFPAPISQLNADEWRAIAAHRIFAQNAAPAMPPGALGLAMVAVEGARVKWVDAHMVRRDCAAAPQRDAGFGVVSEAMRTAHFAQFDALVRAEMAARPSFAASEIAMSLPPMGRMPVGAVARRAGPGQPFRLSQNWLPPAMPVELVALPEDEIAALLRESIHLPPIDLTARDEELANIPVTIAIPVPRSSWMDTPAEVAEAQALTAPVAVGGTPTSPADLLRALIDGGPVASASGALSTDAWTEILSRASELWFLRRRQFQRSDENFVGRGADSDGGGGGGDGGGHGGGDAAELADRIIKGLKARLGLFAERVGIHHPEELTNDLPPTDRAIVLSEIDRLAERGPATVAAALALRARDKPDEAVKIARILAAGGGEAYRAAEPLLFGRNLSLDVAGFTAGGEIDHIKFVREVTGFGLRLAKDTVQGGMPARLLARKVDGEAALSGILKGLQELKPDVEITTYRPFEDIVHEPRKTLLESGLTLELAVLPQRLGQAKTFERLPRMHKALFSGGDPVDIGRELVEIARGN